MPLIGTEQFYTTDAFRPQEQGFAVPRMSPARAASTILDCVPESIAGPGVVPIAGPGVVPIAEPIAMPIAGTVA